MSSYSGVWQVAVPQRVKRRSFASWLMCAPITATEMRGDQGCPDGIGELVGPDPMGVYRARRLVAVQAGTLPLVGVVLTEPAQIADAATQLVTNCNDARPSSRRQAVLHVTSGHSLGFSAPAVSGDNASRIITIASGITAALSGLTVENGNTSGASSRTAGLGLSKSGTLRESNDLGGRRLSILRRTGLQPGWQHLCKLTSEAPAPPRLVVQVTLSKTRSTPWRANLASSRYSRSDTRRTAFGVGAAVTLAYLLIQQGQVTVSDGRDMLAVSQSIVHHGTLSVAPQFGVMGRGGHHFAKYGIGLSLLAVPFVAFGDLVSVIAGHQARLESFFAASLVPLIMGFLAASLFERHEC